MLTLNNPKNKIKKTIPFAIGLKIILLTKGIQNVYSENYRSLLKQIKENLNKQKDVPCLQIARLTIIKMVLFPKLIHRFKTLPIRIPPGFHLGI